MLKENRVFDLEDRLINFAVLIIRQAESLPKTKKSGYGQNQI